MEIIKGSEISHHILSGLETQVSKLLFTPLFCDVLVGDDPVAASYVKIKARRAEEIGLKFELVTLPADTTTEGVIAKLKTIQQDPFLSGLIVQLPLPAHLDKSVILNSIDPRVDVDCLGEENTKAFYEGKAKIVPPTAAAVMAVLESLRIDLKPFKFLVIGQGELVGRPVTALLRARGLDIKTADASTANLSELTMEAEVIVSGVGQSKLIHGDMIKSGTILIDCGTSESSGSIVGDIDAESVASKAKFLAPVPGGVGPVTVAKLLENVVKVAQDLE
jgi:methylenetetrahydrofolate dehydrogenase (NADP+)/methenyltetrahydrofolate cyclohydrolase